MNNQSHPPAQSDPFGLNRFVEAQAGVYERALAELKRAQKESHWMWFIFPLLGPRLIECSKALLPFKGKSASDIFGFPDDLKLRSSMTLFASVSEPDSVFSRVLDQYFAGQPDQRTLELLRRKFSS